MRSQIHSQTYTKADRFWMGCCVCTFVCGRWVCMCLRRRRNDTNVDLCFLFACHYRCCRCCCCCCFQSFYLIFKFNVSLAMNECHGYDHIDTHMIHTIRYELIQDLWHSKFRIIKAHAMNWKQKHKSWGIKHKMVNKKDRAEQRELWCGVIDTFMLEL